MNDIKPKIESNMMDKIYDMSKRFFKRMLSEFKASIRKVTIDGIGWTALLALHAVTIPMLIGLMTGLSDKTPPIDMVLILWVGMALLYFKSILEKNIVSIIIIGLGFIAQSVLMALVFFK
jgi:hypothetical protein